MTSLVIPLYLEQQECKREQFMGTLGIFILFHLILSPVQG